MAETAKKIVKSGNKTGNGTMLSPRNGAVCPTGAHPGNTGGKPGRSGRKAKDFRQLCGEAVDKYARPKAAKVLKTQEPGDGEKANPTWWAAASYLARYGQPEPPKEVNAKIGGTVILKAVRE